MSNEQNNNRNDDDNNTIIQKSEKENYRGKLHAIVTHNFRHSVNYTWVTFASEFQFVCYFFYLFFLHVSLFFSVFRHHFKRRQFISVYLCYYVQCTQFWTKRMPFKLHIQKQTNRRMRECTGMRAFMLRVHPMFRIVIKL